MSQPDNKIATPPTAAEMLGEVLQRWAPIVGIAAEMTDIDAVETAKAFAEDLRKLCMACTEEAHLQANDMVKDIVRKELYRG